MSEAIETLKQWIGESGSIVFFGGAGVSTESGIPDFRSVDGLYNQKYSEPPEEIISHSYFVRWPEKFYRFYKEKMLYPEAKPNDCHLALAKLEAEGKCEKPIWGFLLPLAGRCRLGDIAALLTSQTPEEADAALERIDDLTALPVFAFVHALKTGAEFPIPTKPLTVGESDRFALALRSDPAFLNELAVFAASEGKTDQELLWAHSLTFSAQRLKDAEAVHDEALLRAFVRAQSAFLPRCYSAYALAHPEFLPSAHRFAFHLTNAFSVLAPTAVAPEFPISIEKNLRAALRSLKEAAVAAPEQKKFINALLDTLTTA